jgi:hypothetical protein
LWEVRTSLANNRIARVIFCFHDEELLPSLASSRRAARHPRASSSSL